MKNKILTYWILIILLSSCLKNPNEIRKVEFLNPGIVFVSTSGLTSKGSYKLGLTIIDANGNNRVDIYKGRGAYFWNPVFSPDGSKIVFVRELDNIDQNAVFIIDVDGKNLKQVSRGYDNLGYPQFLPDNINVVYKTRTSSQNWEFRVVNILTQEDKLVCNGDFSWISPEITSDGHWLVFWEDGYLFKINLTNSTKYRITDRIAFGETFDLNKQTNEIVFRAINTDVPNNRSIAKINLDGSNLVLYNFYGQFPKISNDGNHILYMAVGNGEPSIWKSNIEGDSTQIVLSYYTWDMLADFYPSGDRIIFVRSVDDMNVLFSCNLDGDNLTQIAYMGELFPGFNFNP